ncbi:hypothetical protein B0H67DRAFT_212271 [Lasiosphaeris hirsuta]|uniref:Uncharacterized protein n=1 Tax=Lasiosphaeris hirsuta TaxID=260670 RepID=A0AA40E3D0_9PEZI|nr:hypothetical protein B0H67DRAFT_212271 [Lasiosphaeris hirsuta]
MRIISVRSLGVLRFYGLFTSLFIAGQPRDAVFALTRTGAKWSLVEEKRQLYMPMHGGNPWKPSGKHSFCCCPQIAQGSMGHKESFVYFGFVVLGDIRLFSFGSCMAWSTHVGSKLVDARLCVFSLFLASAMRICIAHWMAIIHA